MKTSWLWITLLISMAASPNAHAWGALGHRIITAYGSELVEPATLANCHIKASELVDHTNDPDSAWKQQRAKHPKEKYAHFFQIDDQPADWRSMTRAKNPEYGTLVYRIVDWQAGAVKLRREGKWDELAEKLYGLSHYIGDLTQPLHAAHDYDGEAAGLKGLHGDFETKMLNRFEDDARRDVKRLNDKQKDFEKLWSAREYNQIIFDVAEESSKLKADLFKGAKLSIAEQRSGKKKKKSKRELSGEVRFDKKKLWANTGELAVKRLSLASKLWAHTLNTICK